MSDTSADSPIDRAWAALEEGRPEEALALLEGADPEDGERWSAASLAHLDLGDARAAESALERARGASPADAPDVLYAAGELDLALWRLPEATQAFEALAEVRPSWQGLERLALCLDLTGDTEGSDRALRRAHGLDPGARPLPPGMTPEEFEDVVSEAVTELPEPFRSALDDVPVVIDDVPSVGVVGGGGLETPPDLLGLFVGVSLLDRTHDASAELPAAVFLFRRNLERACRDRDELREQIRVTLYHELGHALGFDEDGVEEMGLA